MIPQANRLSQKKDFQKIFSQGNTFKGKFFILRYLPQKLNSFRAAVITSAKVSKKAVQRNKIRRRIYEIIKTYPLKTVDLIVITKRPILKLKFSALEKEVENALVKANLLENGKRRSNQKNQKTKE